MLQYRMVFCKVPSANVYSPWMTHSWLGVAFASQGRITYFCTQTCESVLCGFTLRTAHDTHESVVRRGIACFMQFMVHGPLFGLVCRHPIAIETHAWLHTRCAAPQSTMSNSSGSGYERLLLHFYACSHQFIRSDERDANASFHCGWHEDAMCLQRLRHPHILSVIEVPWQYDNLELSKLSRACPFVVSKASDVW